MPASRVARPLLLPWRSADTQSDVTGRGRWVPVGHRRRSGATDVGSRCAVDLPVSRGTHAGPELAGPGRRTSRQVTVDRPEAGPDQERTAPFSGRSAGADPPLDARVPRLPRRRVRPPWRRLPRPEATASALEWRRGGQFTVGAEDELMLVD